MTVRHQLVVVTTKDHAAHEWSSLFAHEIVFSGTPRQNPAIAVAA
jgi:hypothetical protein